MLYMKPWSSTCQAKTVTCIQMKLCWVELPQELLMSCKFSLIYSNRIIHLTNFFFDILRQENVSNIMLKTMSEQEHCSRFLHPFINLIFLRRNKDYEVRLDHSVKEIKLRPDLSCIVDGISVLNSKIKPLGCGPLKQKKDIVKSHLQVGKTINQFLFSKGDSRELAIFLNCGLFLVYCHETNNLSLYYLLNYLLKITGDIIQTYIMDLQYDGIYRSWAFLKSKLIIDEPSLSLIESNFAHFVVLKVLYMSYVICIRAYGFVQYKNKKNAF